MTATEFGRGSASAAKETDASSSRRLFIGNLHPDVSSIDLRERFENFGTVQDVDVRNKNDATFAFIDISFNDKEHGLRKCIDLLNNTRWKGLTMKVQPAKENFIEKLKKEREMSRNLKRPRPPDNFDFEIVSSTPALDELTNDNVNNPKLNGRRTADADTAVRFPVLAKEQCPVRVLRAGLRSATNSAPAPIPSSKNKIIAPASHSKPKEPVQISSASSDSDSSDEDDTRKTKKPQLPMFRGILSYPSLQEVKPKRKPIDTQTATVIANSSSTTCAIIPSTAKAPPSTGFKINPLKKQRSDALRVQSLQTQNELKKSREAIIRQALSNANLAEQQKNESRPHQSSSAGAQSKTKAEGRTDFLFGASDDDNNDGIEDENQFKIKPQYEGEAGQRLMELGSKFGGDERFRMDERFVEENSVSASKATEGRDGDGEAEKQTQLNVLSEMFGPGILAASTAKHVESVSAQSNKDRIEPSALGLVRYQPSSADHKRKYEIKVEDSGSAKAAGAISSVATADLSPSKSKRDKKSKETAKQVEQQQQTAGGSVIPVPAEVPKPVYKVAPNLMQLFSNGAGASSEAGVAPAKFSLLSSFGSDREREPKILGAERGHRVDAEAEDEDRSDSDAGAGAKLEKYSLKSGQGQSDSKTSFWISAKPNPFKYDSSDDEGEGGGGDRSKKKSSSYEPGRKDLTSQLNLFKGESFFYTEDDPRLIGVLESFMKSDEDIEAVKARFNDGGRSELKTIVRAKWKNSKRKNEKRIKAIKLARKKKRRDAVKKMQHHEKVRAIRESRANQD